MVFDAIRAGAQAYLLKDSEEIDVLNTVRAVHEGESALSPQIARKVMDQFRVVAGNQMMPSEASTSVNSAAQPVSAAKRNTGAFADRRRKKQSQH